MRSSIFPPVRSAIPRIAVRVLCGFIATVLTVILAWVNFCNICGDGGWGSPSEMMIICLTEASLLRSAARPLFMVGTKLGISCGAALLIFFTKLL